MASGKQIRDGLFSISWNTTAATYNQQQTAEVTNLVDVFKFCQLGFTTNGVNAVLEIEIHFSDTTKSIKMENMYVESSKNGVKQKMTISQSKWTASWNEDSTKKCLRCIRTAGTAGINFDILIDLTPINSPKKTSQDSQPVLDHLLNLWKTKTLADVEFRCNGKSIKAHTLILASGSPILAAMFRNDLIEKQKRVVEILEIKANIFENLLQYIYTGEAALETKVEDVSQLLIAADKYGVETLKEECAMYLSKDLKIENAARYLVIAHLHNSTVLHEATLQFMSQNAKAVCARKDWMDIIKDYPELCFQATQLMVGL